MDNLTAAETKLRQLIVQIQELYASEASISQISRIVGKKRQTVTKYIIGDPDILCRSKQRSSSLGGYDDLIIKSIEAGLTQSDIAKELKEAGYAGTGSNARMYICAIAKQQGLELAKYCRDIPSGISSKQRTVMADYITRKGIFNYLWMNNELTETHHEYLWNKYGVLCEVEQCIREFREVFRKKNLPMLYIFIDKYRSSQIKELVSFATGLQRDIDAVENAVASPLSNGFVEGSNSKVKTIKKTMYGRCGIKLLSAKLMYGNTG